MTINIRLALVLEGGYNLDTLCNRFIVMIIITKITTIIEIYFLKTWFPRQIQHHIHHHHHHHHDHHHHHHGYQDDDHHYDDHIITSVEQCTRALMGLTIEKIPHEELARR